MRKSALLRCTCLIALLVALLFQASQAQGLDLTPYQGKRAMLYTYALTAYPTGEQGVTANLLVRRNRLIAADITSAQTDGFVHGLLDMPQT